MQMKLLKKILIFSIIMKFMVILDLYHSNVLRKNIKIFIKKVKSNHLLDLLEKNVLNVFTMHLFLKCNRILY